MARSLGLVLALLCLASGASAEVVAERIDEANFLGTGLSISQNVSVALLAAAAVGWLILLRQPAGSKLVELPPGDFGGQARTSPAGAA